MDVGRFFSSLFDLSFDRFVTTEIIRVLYVILVVAAGVVGLFLLISGLATMMYGPILVGLVQILILAPLAFILSVVYARVVLELIMVIFHISRDVSAIEAKLRED